jgi:hypothetical protein
LLSNQKIYLEAELLEEPAVGVGVVAGLEDLLEELARLGLAGGVGDGELAAEFLGEIHVVAGGEDVLLVDNAEEGTDVRAASDAALGHTTDDALGVLLDASDESVAVLTFLSLLFLSLDNNSLVAGIASVGHDNNAARFDEAGHFLLDVFFLKSFFLVVEKHCRMHSNKCE